jgi:plastocyanin
MRRAQIDAGAVMLCLLCVLLAGSTGAVTALAQTHAPAPGSPPAQARNDAKRGHATKRSRCARSKRHHAKRAERCRNRHASRKPAKPVAPAPAPLVPAALLSVPVAPAPPAPLAAPVVSSPTPATTPSEAPPGETPSEVEPPSVPHVQVSAVEYSFTLSRTNVPAGEVVLEFVNNGQDEHNLHLENGEGPRSESIGNTPSKGVDDLHLQMRPGSYTLFCSLPTHEARGMKATLTVE